MVQEFLGAIFVPKYEMGKVRGLWRLDSRHDSEHKVGKAVEKGRGRLPPPKTGKHAIAGTCAAGRDAGVTSPGTRLITY
jgi:hypothetical protein